MKHVRTRFRVQGKPAQRIRSFHGKQRTGERPEGPEHPGHGRCRIHRQPYLRRADPARLPRGHRGRPEQFQPKIAVDRMRATSRGIDADRRDSLRFYKQNILDREALDAIFAENDVDAIIHFAGFKAVGESVQKPLEYYWNNIAGTLVLCDVARNHGVKNIVFSSQRDGVRRARVRPHHRGVPQARLPPTPTDGPRACSSSVLTDLYVGDNEWNVVLLRYFNPIGAHESGLIGEDPKGIPNNLLPYVAQVAVGKLECVGVFGDDYDTPGRHGRARLHPRGRSGARPCGSARMDGRQSGHRQAPLRPWRRMQGEASRRRQRAAAWASSTWAPARARACSTSSTRSRAPAATRSPTRSSRAAPATLPRTTPLATRRATELGWVAEYDLDRMCADSWRWQSMNPDGYATEQ